MNILHISNTLLIFASLAVFLFAVLSRKSTHLIYKSFIKVTSFALFLFSLSKVAGLFNIDSIGTFFNLMALLVLIFAMFIKTISFIKNDFT